MAKEIDLWEGGLYSEHKKAAKIHQEGEVVRSLGRATRSFFLSWSWNYSFAATYLASHCLAFLPS